ncbi:Hypothetical predicted protein, partial [Paramuricea clavata]
YTRSLTRAVVFGGQFIFYIIVFLFNMKVTSTLIIFSLLCLLVVQGRFLQRCKKTADCDFGECCSRRRCKHRLPAGYRCNAYRMFIGLQCPCAPGYSCKNRSKHSSRRRTCKPMNRHYPEIIESKVIE